MKNNGLKAIETRYKGYRFRSRLEARWAVFFDALGVAWEYEPEGFDLGDAGWYLPDFKVTYPEGYLWWFEVKGYLAGVTPSEWEKLLAFEKLAHNFCVLDGMPELRMYQTPTLLLDPDEKYHGEGHRIARPLRLPATSVGNFGYALWCYKSRPWWDEFSNVQPVDGDDLYEMLHIEAAANAARAARFGKGGRG